MLCTTVTTGESNVQHLKAAVEITRTQGGTLINIKTTNLISKAAHTGGWVVVISGMASKDARAVREGTDTRCISESTSSAPTLLIDHDISFLVSTSDSAGATSIPSTRQRHRKHATRCYPIRPDRCCRDYQRGPVSTTSPNTAIHVPVSPSLKLTPITQDLGDLRCSQQDTRRQVPMEYHGLRQPGVPGPCGVVRDGHPGAVLPRRAGDGGVVPVGCHDGRPVHHLASTGGVRLHASSRRGRGWGDGYYRHNGARGAPTGWLSGRTYTGVQRHIPALALLLVRG